MLSLQQKHADQQNGLIVSWKKWLLHQKSFLSTERCCGIIFKTVLILLSQCNHIVNRQRSTTEKGDFRKNANQNISMHILKIQLLIMSDGWIWG